MSAAVAQARAELEAVREDLEDLNTLAGHIAVATKEGQAIDHQTVVELVAHVAGALSALGTAETCLVEDGESESEVAP